MKKKDTKADSCRANVRKDYRGTDINKGDNNAVDSSLVKEDAATLAYNPRNSK